MFYDARLDSEKTQNSATRLHNDVNMRTQKCEQLGEGPTGPHGPLWKSDEIHSLTFRALDSGQSGIFDSNTEIKCGTDSITKIF